MLKTTILAASVLGGTMLLGDARGPRQQLPTAQIRLVSADGNTIIHAMGVRADYRELPTRRTRTTCYVTNTSVAWPIVLKQVYVAGENGVNSPISVYSGLLDRVVPPLGSVELSIGTNIPGVTLETPTSGPGVRRVIFLWDGPPDAMKLHATIDSREPSNAYTRAEFVEEGYVIGV